jgi:hypothetical protein
MLNRNPLSRFKDIIIRTSCDEFPLQDVIAMSAWPLFEFMVDRAGDSAAVGKDHAFVEKPFMERGSMGLERSDREVHPFARGDASVEAPAIENATNHQNKRSPRAQREKIEGPEKRPEPVPGT